MFKFIEEYGIIAKGVIHVGAHSGQEYELYIESGIDKILLFEPVKSNFLKLLDHIECGNKNVYCFNIALGNETGEREMFIETSNQGMSCSILEPKEHLNQYPWIQFKTKELVIIDKLDNIKFNRKDFNILNIDVQGFELEVFKGAIGTLKTIDAIFTEVNIKEMYKGCALISDLDYFLGHNGFVRITEQPPDSWGEAVYIKNKFVKD
jgi:FkbM family methyltransferase